MYIPNKIILTLTDKEKEDYAQGYRDGERLAKEGIPIDEIGICTTMTRVWRVGFNAGYAEGFDSEATNITRQYIARPDDQFRNVRAGND
jgi:hypothetical protein